MSTQIDQQLKATGLADVIVVLRPAAATAAAAGALERHFSTSPLGRRSALAAAGFTGRAEASPPMRYFPNLGVAYGTVDRAGLAALRAAKNAVAAVGGAPPLSLIRPTHAVAARLEQKVAWGLAALGAPELWAQGLTGRDVRVGHLDTGVDGRHAALRHAVVDFAEFDVLGREVTPKPPAHDTGDHGTHTAATIAGRPVRGRAVGVAPGAGLASAIVIEGGDVVARVLGGMDWAVGRRVRILSMSLGFRGWWEDFLPLTDILRDRGILPVFAVGNEGPGTSRSPGNYWQALSVGASDRRRKVAEFSSSQRFRRRRDPVVPDLVAPGVDVISAAPGGGYQMMDGTSMATPHVAGLAALLWEAKPKATAAEVEAAIFRSCQPGPGMDPERGNRGIPHGPRALAALLAT
jgi:subtilisin family serine protease